MSLALLGHLLGDLGRFEAVEDPEVLWTHLVLAKKRHLSRPDKLGHLFIAQSLDLLHHLLEGTWKAPFSLKPRVLWSGSALSMTP